MFDIENPHCQCLHEMENELPRTQHCFMTCTAQHAILHKREQDKINLEAKKQAKELIDTYYSKIDWVTRAMPDTKMELAKDLALVAVGITIKEHEKLGTAKFSSDWIFWQDVKLEIEGNE